VPSHVTLHAKTRGALTVYPLERARAFGVDAFITDRFGGVSGEPYDSLNLAYHVGDDRQAVDENRRRVAAAIDVAESQLVTVQQVHGADVLNAASVMPSSEADALIYEDSDLALAMLTADCLPLLVVDASSPRYAVVHAGWRGLRVGVIARALAQFANPESLHAFVGPSISFEAYQVGPDVAQYFEGVSDALCPDGGDRSRLDLRRVATSQLFNAGVPEDHVECSAQVTDGGEVFFSDRAQRPCGRFALVARRLVA
jgi:YfiH family protein